jgi:hypothetical protein
MPRARAFARDTERPLQVFESLPPSMRAELLLERDQHGNPNVARIETEKLLIKLVSDELSSRKDAGTYAGKFNGLSHYFGYEGRCSLPTNFDATCGALSLPPPMLFFPECSAFPGVSLRCLTNSQARARSRRQASSQISVHSFLWPLRHRTEQRGCARARSGLQHDTACRRVERKADSCQQLLAACRAIGPTARPSFACGVVRALACVSCLCSPQVLLRSGLRRRRADRAEAQRLHGDHSQHGGTDFVVGRRGHALRVHAQHGAAPREAEARHPQGTGWWPPPHQPPIPLPCSATAMCPCSDFMARA